MEVIQDEAPVPQQAPGAVLRYQGLLRSIPFSHGSPSMTEGIDLKDDLSRFQIICKVPYPQRNPYIIERQLRDPDGIYYRRPTFLIPALTVS
jgi:Rad3-related DNA helicase